MTRDRTQVFGAGLALLVLVLLVFLDATIPPQYAILTGLFGLAPLIACAVVSCPRNGSHRRPGSARGGTLRHRGTTRSARRSTTSAWST